MPTPPSHPTSEPVRCHWARHPLEVVYHDTEWGVPLHDDRKLFEFIVLDTFQAGLSWLIVLKKREGFRRAFDDFDPVKIAAYEQTQIESILQNPDIIRNRLKVAGTVRNAQAFLRIQVREGSFAKYIWALAGGSPIVNGWQEAKQVPPRTELSDQISKALQKEGFTFVGSTVVYAFLQAAGLVNDHLVSCHRYGALQG